MSITSRRDVLWGTAAVSALTALKGLPDLWAENGKKHQPPQIRSQNSVGQLNVCCHGLWYIEFRKDRVNLYAPSVPDHVYRAGWWKQEADLEKNKWYDLAGLSPRTVFPTLDPTQYPILKSAPTPVMALMSASLKVPLPDAVYGLRCVKRQEGAPYYAPNGKYAPSADLQCLPMNLILVYGFDPTVEFPYLKGSTWKAPNPYHNTINLHFRAEPLEINPHTTAQYCLQQALGITNPADLALSELSGALPDDPVPLYGFATDEERGLAELFPRRKDSSSIWDVNGYATTVQAANCSSVIGNKGS